MSDLTSAPLQSVTDIMQKHGARCTAAEFHAAVNVAFHNFESEVYDQEHADMWDSLPQQFNLLVEDCLQHYPALLEKDLCVLDIGCGTGLASNSLLGTRLGPRIKSIDLLDTSTAMLKQALQRSAQWKVPVNSHLGLLDSLPAENKYNVIVTCSVLHHVPDLRAFCDGVARHHAPGGVFLHLQDPNGTIAENPVFQRRTAELNNRQPKEPSRFTPKRILGRIYRELTGKQSESYIVKTNRALLDSGIVTTPLKVTEIYAITDIHVDDGHGISVDEIGGWLPAYENLSHRSYGFFNGLLSVLPQDLKEVEEELIRNNSLEGAHVAAAWRRIS